MNAIPLKELKKQYQLSHQRFVEVTDKQSALKDIASTASCTWGAGHKFGETGWIQLATPSPEHKGDTSIVFVCKASLLEGHSLQKPPCGVV